MTERCPDCEWEGCRAREVEPRKSEERLACYERTIARLRAAAILLTADRDAWKRAALLRMAEGE